MIVFGYLQGSYLPLIVFGYDNALLVFDRIWFSILDSVGIGQPAGSKGYLLVANRQVVACVSNGRPAGIGVFLLFR